MSETATDSDHDNPIFPDLARDRIVDGPLHRDRAVIERASDRSRHVHHRERPKAANITLPWIGLR
jgi:hypothetical protein